MEVNFNEIFLIIYKFFTNKYLKNIVIFFVSFFLIWYVIPPLSYNVSVENINLDILLRGLLTIFVMIALIYFSFSVAKNKTKLPGIGFYINSSLINGRDFRKTLFFNSLKDNLKEKFNIIVYDKEDFFSFDKKDKLKLMENLNLMLLFEVSEKNGMRNNINFYEIKISKSNIKFEIPISSGICFYFQREFVNAINTYFKISEINSLNDLDSEVNSLDLQLSYIVSIIWIISRYPERAFDIIDNLSLLLNRTKDFDKNTTYIKNNLPLLYLRAYSNCVNIILHYENYYDDYLLLGKLECYNENFKSTIVKYDNFLCKKEKKALLSDYLSVRAIIQYERGDIKESLQSIHEIDLTLTPNEPILFSKAFLLAHNFQFKKSYQLYHKLSKRKNVSIQLINSIIRFIEIRFEGNENNLALKFCMAIVNYYFKDRELALKYFDELIEINDQIKIIYDEFISYEEEEKNVKR